MAAYQDGTVVARWYVSTDLSQQPAVDVFDFAIFSVRQSDGAWCLYPTVIDFIQTSYGTKEYRRFFPASGWAVNGGVVGFDTGRSAWYLEIPVVFLDGSSVSANVRQYNVSDLAEGIAVAVRTTGYDVTESAIGVYIDGAYAEAGAADGGGYDGPDNTMQVTEVVASPPPEFWTAFLRTKEVV